MTTKPQRFWKTLPLLSGLLSFNVILACLPSGEVGESCETTGDGFTRRDPCRELCVDWEIACEDGTRVNPMICAGELCEDTGCPSGFVCMQIDSFADNSRCLPDDVCNR